MDGLRDVEMNEEQQKRTTRIYDKATISIRSDMMNEIVEGVSYK